MDQEKAICARKIVLMNVRIDAQPFINEGLRQVGLGMFRTAIVPFEEGKRVLAAAPKEVRTDLCDYLEQVEGQLTMCQDKLKYLTKFGPRYWKKAQLLHGQDTPEAQSKASVLYKHAATAFANVQEQRAEAAARKLQQETAENAIKCSIKKSKHLEIMDEFEESIAQYDWLKAWLEFCESPQDIHRVDLMQRSVYNKRAIASLLALTHMCDDGLRQLERGYRRGVKLLGLIHEDLSVAHYGGALTEEESSEISTLSHRLKELQKLSDTWLKADRIDVKTCYDERMHELTVTKKMMIARCDLC